MTPSLETLIMRYALAELTLEELVYYNQKYGTEYLINDGFIAEIIP